MPHRARKICYLVHFILTGRQASHHSTPEKSGPYRDAFHDRTQLHS
ncbi:hypothetical protein Q7O_003542 [Pectobacterium carotovorum subsp. carotovorum PCCS1]|nr:hypothetical protein [Pectobacterium carotovorum subsp. carotovorum PCCS1]